MKIEEFKKIQKLSYKQYCKYLKDKYGESKYNYFTQNFSSVKNCKRTAEGLVVHHIFENEAILLGNPKYAKKNPYDYQLAKNLVYCDLLEHLWLHILICKESSLNKIDNGQYVGIGGIINFLIPELNDYFYCGWKTTEEWRKKIHERISFDKKTYTLILSYLKSSKILNKYPNYSPGWYYESLNNNFPGKSWNKKNREAYTKFIKLFFKKDDEFNKWLNLNSNDNKFDILNIFTIAEFSLKDIRKHLKRDNAQTFADINKDLKIIKKYSNIIVKKNFSFYSFSNDDIDSILWILAWTRRWLNAFIEKLPTKHSWLEKEDLKKTENLIYKIKLIKNLIWC